MAAPTSRPLLLYDGQCGLCNELVRLLLRLDRRAALRFAPLQGPTGQRCLRNYGLNTGDFDSLVFVRDMERTDEGYALRTNGVIEVFARLGGPWRAARIFRLVPAALRDLLYRFVARSRYRLFGEYRPRPLEHPEWSERILP
jgi:predicted DCC family thiol-disulfide oxidoreductase YuxK